MNLPWAKRSFLEWTWVQLRTGLRQHLAYPIPDLDHPGRRSSVVSTRHWLNRQQAAAVRTFGIEFGRAIAAFAAEQGATPINNWIDQRWRTHAGQPNRHLTFMDPRGVDNCAELVSKIIYPADALTFHQIIKTIVPKVIERLPLELTQTVGKPGQHLISPYQWTIDLKTPYVPGSSKSYNHLREVVVMSPYYYCGYTEANAYLPVDKRSEQMPLNPDITTEMT